MVKYRQAVNPQYYTGSVINMVKIIMGLKGSGKTKQLLEQLNKAVEEDNGCVVCIEKEPSLRFSIPSQARHVCTSYYDGKGLDFLKGIICGLHAGNYDISQFFVDGFYKIIDGGDTKGVDSFIIWLAEFSEREKVDFTLTLSADVSAATETIRKYL